MRIPSSRPQSRAIILAALLVSVVLVSLVQAQTATQDPPLYRHDAGSTVGAHRPNALLAADANLFLRGDAATGTVAVPFSMLYKCINASTSGTNPQLDPNCNLGAAPTGASTARTVTVEFTINGTDPAATTPSTLALNQTGAVNAPPHNDETFAGGITQSRLANRPDGTVLTWRVRVPVSATTPVGTAPATCSATSANCFDPVDTTGQTVYRARLDYSVPALLLADTANAVAREVTPNQWYVYSNQAMSNLLPDLVITVVDNFNGSAVDHARTQFFRNNTEVADGAAALFQLIQSTTHTATFRYNYQLEGGQNFAQNTATEIDVRAFDVVGHRLDTLNRTNDPGVWVIMDNTPPVLNQTTSKLARAPGSSGLAALGEGLRVYVNATDHAATNVLNNATVATPRQHLKVEVELAGGPNNATRSAKMLVPFNATLGYHYSDEIIIPSPWVTGRTHAFVTVTDPVGQSVTHAITGFVNVDVDNPVITPLAPIGTTQATGFTRETSVAFRLRAQDPGDGDTWKATDTDDLGIDHAQVRVHYRIGVNGTTSTAQLTAQNADHTFATTRTFDAEDHIYYYFSVRDLAGNVVTYPGATSPAVNLTGVTDNGGRFLSLQIDQVGPAIAEARDHAYLGAGPIQIRLQISDPGSGVNTGTVRLQWRLQGETSFRELTMTANGTGSSSVYTAELPAQSDGARIQWYATASDLLGNTASLGSATSPRVTIIDTLAPTVQVTAPSTSSSPIFNVTWLGSDAGSGVANYTLEFRVAGGSWFTIPSRTNTTEVAYQFCAAGGKTYEFRVQVRDRAGNARLPTTADASTQVMSTTDCAQPAEVAILAPTTGATLSGPETVQWNAVSTAFPDDVVVRIEIGNAGTFQAVATGLASSGTRTWATNAPAQTDVCLVDGTYTLRVTAVDPHGLEGSASIAVSLANGITDCLDRDNDDLPDSWEFEHFDHLDFDGADDSDSDGATNAAEFAAGTDPSDATSRPEGGPAGGWNDLYILVILAFVAVLGVFAVGITRRW